MKIDSSITTDRVVAACESGDNAGFCVACGCDACGVEPDARNYECEECGERKVFGAEELLFHVVA